MLPRNKIRPGQFRAAHWTSRGSETVERHPYPRGRTSAVTDQPSRIARGRGATSRRGSKKLFLSIVPLLVLVFLFSYFPLYGWVYSLFDYRPARGLSGSCLLYTSPSPRDRQK